MNEETFHVKRFRVDQGAVDTEIRFLRKGDLFWSERRGKPVPLPLEFSDGKKHKTLFYVAMGNPIWAKERNGTKTFLGLKYREANQDEIKLIAHSQTTRNRPSA